MSLKNLTIKLKNLSGQLTDARNVAEPDEDLIIDLEAQIADVEDQIEKETSQQYEDRHNQSWN